MELGQDVDSILKILNEDDFLFCIAIGSERESFNHCALIYKWKEKTKVIDFYCGKIRNNISYGDLHQWSYLKVRYNKNSIPHAFAMQVPSFCEAIIEAKETLNYGLTYNNTIFDSTGHLQLNSKDIGLTCATFILSIFQSISINLIDTTTWKYREDDIAWQNNILNLLEKNKDQIESDVLNHCSQNIGCYRFRPEEVASSISYHRLPIDFETCKNLGAKLIEIVNDGIEY